MRSWKIVTILVIIFITILVATIKISSSGIPENQIAIIPIAGMLTSSNSIGFSYQVTDTEFILDSLEKAEKNNNIKAIILEINSPGGTVVASKEIADKVKKIEKPTVALIREVGASGAYWIASSADYVISDELSITGSIGVLSSYIEFAGFLEAHNLEYKELTAGKYKEVGNPLRELQPDEEIILKDKLKKIQEVFLREIQEKRRITNIEEIKTGKFYLGFEAREIGLVDELGNKDSAVKKAEELANIKDSKLMEYEPRKTIFDLFSPLSAGAFYSIGRGIGSELKIDTTSPAIHV